MWFVDSKIQYCNVLTIIWIINNPGTTLGCYPTQPDSFAIYHIGTFALQWPNLIASQT